MNHFLILIILLAVIGCESDARRSFTSKDSWYAPAPANDQFTPIGIDHFAPVIESLQAESQVVLTEVSFKQISVEEANRLAGQHLPSGQIYVLLRGVVLNEGTGGFQIKMHDKAVYVDHGCLGHRPRSMKRKAMVAVLPRLPEAVYVSCSMAE